MAAHGTTTCYRRGCRCADCRAAEAQDNRAHRLRRGPKEAERHRAWRERNGLHVTQYDTLRRAARTLERAHQHAEETYA